MLNNHLLSSDYAANQHSTLYKKKITHIHDCLLTYVFHFQMCLPFHSVFHLLSMDFFFLQKAQSKFPSSSSW